MDCERLLSFSSSVGFIDVHSKIGNSRRVHIVPWDLPHSFFHDLKMSLQPPSCLLPPIPFKIKKKSDHNRYTLRWILDNQFSSLLCLINMVIKKPLLLKMKGERILRPEPVFVSRTHLNHFNILLAHSCESSEVRISWYEASQHLHLKHGPQYQDQTLQRAMSQKSPKYDFSFPLSPS
jgi:hypothetical protein